MRIYKGEHTAILAALHEAAARELLSGWRKEDIHEIILYNFCLPFHLVPCLSFNLGAKFYMSPKTERLVDIMREREREGSISSHQVLADSGDSEHAPLECWDIVFDKSTLKRWSEFNFSPEPRATFPTFFTFLNHGLWVVSIQVELWVLFSDIFSYISSYRFVK